MSAGLLFVSDLGQLGGGERCLLEWVTETDRRGRAVGLVAPPGELLDAARARGIAVWEVRADIGASRRAREVLRQAGPVAVHLNSYGSLTRAFVGAARRRKIPVAATVSSLSLPGGYRSRRFLRFADRILPVSETVAKQLREGGVPPEKLEVVRPLPTLPPAVRRNPPPPLAGGETGLVLGWVGRLDPVKRLEDALAVFARVREAHPEARMTVAAAPVNFHGGGDPGYGEQILRKIANSELRGSVQVLEQADIWSLLAEIDIFLHTSERETFSRSTFEAMVMGRAIVATDAGAIPELISSGKNGVLRPVGDIDGIATTVLDLWANGSRARELGEAARERALSMIGDEAPVDRLLRVLDGLNEEG